MTEEIINLKLTDIARNPYQPRLSFDKEKMQELTASISENGVMQPIIVRQSRVLGYELLAGERRCLAAKKAGLTEIPAIIRDYTDTDMMTLSIIENLQRENLNPLEEAQSLKNLQEKSELTHSDIAKILGKSRTYVTNAIRVLQLPKEILYLLQKDQITMGHARSLLAVSDPIQQLELARRVIRQKLSVRTLEKLVQLPVSISDRSSAVSADKNIYLADIEQQLKTALGESIKITSSKNYSGKIEISFSDLETLEKIIKKLHN